MNTEEQNIMNNLEVEDNSMEYGSALKSIIDKDMTLLNNNLNKIIEEVIRLYTMYVGSTISIGGIDDAIEKIDELINTITIKKNGVKVSMFSPRKKEKKEEQNVMDTHIDVLNKFKTELYSMKDEYNKLSERKSNIKDDYKPENTPEEVSPLERTLNYFEKKEKGN